MTGFNCQADKNGSILSYLTRVDGGDVRCTDRAAPRSGRTASNLITAMIILRSQVCRYRYCYLC